MIDITSYLADKQRSVEDALQRLLPPETAPPELLHKAMRYSVFAGGKRIRPILCLAAAEALGGNQEPALVPAAAIEVLHTYSLIHDDLPAMDDDDLRRGKPTSHVVFGEANAILAGDALLTFAFELLATQPAPAPYSPTRLVCELAEAAGCRGMVAGQVEDLLAEGKQAVADEVAAIHEKKTGKLLQAAVRMGAISASASRESLDALTGYARRIGLAFQIADDILNTTSTPEELGKAVGTDADRAKMTYVALLGVEAASMKANDLVEEAIASLQKIDGNTEALKALARYVVARNT